LSERIDRVGFDFPWRAAAHALGTMRTHRKRVLSKTGMARQAELAALLAGAAL
jgi:DNA-binding CsgD family transcriptional regulator